MQAILTHEASTCQETAVKPQLRLLERTMLFKGRQVPISDELQPPDEEYVSYEPPPEQETIPTRKSPKKPRVKHTGKPRGAAVAKSPSGLKPGAMRVLNLLYKRGDEEFNALSPKELLKELGGVSRSELSRAKGELERRGYIRRDGKAIYLNDDIDLPEDLPAIQYEGLRGKCSKEDRAKGPDPIMKSALVDEMWGAYFPHASKLTEREVREFLGACGGKLCTLLEELERIRTSGVRIDYPRAYVRVCLKLPSHKKGGVSSPPPAQVKPTVVASRPLVGAEAYVPGGDLPPPSPEYLAKLKEAQENYKRMVKERGWEE